MGTSQGALPRSRAGSWSLALRSTVNLDKLHQSAEVVAKQEVVHSWKPQSRPVAKKRAQSPSTMPFAMSASILLSLFCSSQEQKVEFVPQMSLWKASRPSSYQLPSIVLVLLQVSLSAPVYQDHQLIHFANQQPKLCCPATHWWDSPPLSWKRHQDLMIESHGQFIYLLGKGVEW